MAEVEPMIASAIVVPEAIEPSPDTAAQSPGPGASLKRRQSSTSENDSKRPRLSEDGSTDSPAPAKVEDDRREARRRNGQVEERKRGQRLFGALLGTLSQRATPSTSKRRAEIEHRQKEKLKQQTEEDVRRRQERQEELRAARMRQQFKFDEQNMRLRHSNMLHTAHFLSTTSKPKLYYKPYKLREEHEVQIKHQIEEAEDLIEDELYEFERKRRERDTPSELRAPPKAEDATMEDASSTAAELPAARDELAKKDLDESPSVSNLTTEQQNKALNDGTPKYQSHHNEAMEEDPATAGAEVDSKVREGQVPNDDEEANANAEDGGQASRKEAVAEAVAEAVEETKDEDEDARLELEAEKEAQAEAEMMDEHHGETVVEAEEDTVIY
ncbi:pinin/SDK/memA domain protein [Venturia nashicola]|nr:pinin/SDK/memA domain protein [Venturia nashicola]